MINDRDMVELSTIHAYSNYKQNDTFKVNGNNYNVIELYNEKNGMKYGTDAMLVHSDGEYALIFTGSDKKNDLFKDWVLNNAANALSLDVPQYKEGNLLYKNLSKSYQIKYVGGVSLGGGVSTYVGINNQDVRAVSVNPSPQVTNVTSKKNNVLTIIEENDLLFNLAKTFGRRNKYTKDIVFFNRGNNFFKNIALNHIGFDENVSLDDRLHFDLLTNNNNDHKINVDINDINEVNSNFKSYYDNLVQEVSISSTGHLKSIIKQCRDDIKFNKISSDVINQIDIYMKKTLPTLYNYFEFESFFNELAMLSNKSAFFVLDDIVYTIIKELNLDVINKQLYSDSKVSLYNLNKINIATNSKINGCLTLINSIKNVDEGLIGSVSKVNGMDLHKGEKYVKLNYMFLLENAKNIVYGNLKRVINNYFYIVDLKIDAIVFTLRTSISVLVEVTKLISKEIARKLEIIERILNELYVFNIKDLVYVTLVSLIDELVSIVVVKDIDDKIFAFKKLNSSLNSLCIMYSNYRSYLNNYKSNGIRKLNLNIDDDSSELKKFYNHLNYVYK